MSESPAEGTSIAISDSGGSGVPGASAARTAAPLRRRGTPSYGPRASLASRCSLVSFSGLSRLQLLAFWPSVVSSRSLDGGPSRIRGLVGQECEGSWLTTQKVMPNSIFINFSQNGGNAGLVKDSVKTGLVKFGQRNQTRRRLRANAAKTAQKDPDNDGRPVVRRTVR